MTTELIDLDVLGQAPGFLAFVRGKEHVFEAANAAYYQLVGHRDLVGKPVREALPEIAGQGFFELLDGVFATGEPFHGRGMHVLLQREPDAPLSEAVVDFIYQPIRGPAGDIVGILAQGHEVTEVFRQTAQREAAEAALRASEERYRTLFEAIDDGFCVVQILRDAAGTAVDYRFLEVNAAFEHQSGLVDARGKRMLELVPDLDSSWFDRYGHVAATGEPTRFENYAPAMGRWFDVYANRVGNPAEQLVAVVFKDITGRKAAEVELARILEAERVARRDAEAAGHSRDEFLATVSHELRTPLSSMLGWVQLLRSQALPPDKQARALETIERNARVQAQLIEDLLDVSRIVSGQLRIEMNPFDVKTVVEAALDIVRPAALARDVQLRATLETGAMVVGDAARLQQVVWNLLSNAVKFTPKGGHVEVSVQQRDADVELVVADTGRGIDAGFLPHVFDRFRQAEGVTTRSAGGLGLGLSIVKELVALHGGTVAVASPGLGEGSTFTVTLPASESRRREVTPPRGYDAQPPAAIDFACPPELAGMGVLVVDDEEDSRDMLEVMLARCGVKVRLAANAAEAYAAVQAEVPDLLLSDIGMPGEDGYSLIGRIRALPAAAGGRLPAVALTAYARVEDRAKALHAGFDNHVTKPVEPLELLAVVATFARRNLRGST